MSATEAVRAHEVRTGHLLCVGHKRRIVSQVVRDGDDVILHHGPNSHTTMHADTVCRILTRARRIELIEDDIDESDGGHVWVVSA